MLQIKSVKTGSVSWSIATALSYFYMVSVILLLLVVIVTPFNALMLLFGREQRFTY